MSHSKILTTGIIAALAAAGLAGCSGLPSNTSLYSVHQPVLERSNYTLDLRTAPGGLTDTERQRLTGWLDALNLRYGDRLAIEDPGMSASTRSEVAQLAGQYGIQLSEDAPVTPGPIDPGSARIVLTRTTASVPGCPDWVGKSDFNPRNATTSNYGCATNSNLAAMVADPEDLVRGRDGTKQRLIYGAGRAVREAQPPTDAGGNAAASGTGSSSSSSGGAGLTGDLTGN